MDVVSVTGGEAMVVEALECLLEKRRLEVALLERTLEARRLNIVPGLTVSPLAAALEELSAGPQSTGQLMQALRDRGVRSRSKKPTASLYATLRNSKKVERVDDRWQLK